MIWFAGLLGLVGIVLVGWSAHRLWTSRPGVIGDCDLPSPDGDPCTGTLAHVGWHHRDGLEWYGDEWLIPDHTVAAPYVSRFEFEPAGVGYTKVWGFGLLAAVISFITFGVVTMIILDAPPPQDPHAHCAMSSGYVNALNPYCPDSPDYHPPTKEKQP